LPPKSATALKQPIQNIEIKASWDSLTSAFCEAGHVLFTGRTLGHDFPQPAEAQG
jgi:hypothetical protein